MIPYRENYPMRVYNSVLQRIAAADEAPLLYYVEDEAVAAPPALRLQDDPTATSLVVYRTRLPTIFVSKTDAEAVPSSQRPSSIRRRQSRRWCRIDDVEV